METSYIKRIDASYVQCQQVEHVFDSVSLQLEAMRVRSEQVGDVYGASEAERAALSWKIAHQQQGYMIKLCLECKKYLGLTWTGIAYTESVITHGICSECVKIVFGDL